MEYINGSSVSDQNAINAQFKSINLNSASGQITGNPNINISADEFKWSSKDNKDHFRAYADTIYSRFEFTGDDTGGLLCDFKVPSSENPYDMRIAVGTTPGAFIQNKADLLFTDAANPPNQEFLIKTGINGGVQFPNSTSGYVPSSLNYYEKLIIPLTVTGLTGVSTVNAIIVRVGDNIGLDWGDSGPGIGTGSIITLSGIPPRFTPTGSWRHVTVPVLNNNVEVFSTARVTTLGTIDILGGPIGSVFANAAPAAFYGSGVSYNV